MGAHRMYEKVVTWAFAVVCLVWASSTLAQRWQPCPGSNPSWQGLQVVATQITQDVTQLQGDGTFWRTQSCHFTAFRNGRSVFGSRATTAGVIGGGSGPLHARTFANLSAWIYDGDPKNLPPGARVERLQTRADIGFQGAIIRLADDTLVVAVRGTEGAYGGNIFLANWISNFDFRGTYNPSESFARMVRETAELVAMARRSDPNAHVYITGHSLGGGVAQIVADAAGIPAVTFNAPGAAGAVSGVFLETLPATVPGVSQTCRNCVNNIRYEHDVASLAGDHIGHTFTIEVPDSQHPDLETGWSTVGQNHSIDRTVNVLEGDNYTFSGRRAEDSLKQTLMDQLDRVNQAVDRELSIDTWVERFMVNVLEGEFALFDPKPLESMEFILLNEASPLFRSIVLPSFSDSDLLYGVDIWNGGDWVGAGIATPGVEFIFEDMGVGRFRIEGLDRATSSSEIIPDEFLYYLSFMSSGVAEFSVISDLASPQEPNPTPIRLPPAWALIAIGTTLLGFRERRERLLVRRHVPNPLRS